MMIPRGKPMLIRHEYDVQFIEREELKQILKDFKATCYKIEGNTYQILGPDIDLECQIIDIGKIVKQ